MLKTITTFLAAVVLVICVSLGTPSVTYAESGAPTYYKVADSVEYFVSGTNQANVTMYKPRAAEYYEIIFYPNFFVVVRASANDPDVKKTLQDEVGIRQYYKDNPKTTLVKNDMIKRGFINF